MPRLARVGEISFRNPDGLYGYVGVAAIVLFATALQNWLWAQIEPLAFFLFYPAIYLSSWRFGFGPGITATIASSVIVWGWFLPPFGAPSMTTNALLQVFLFTSLGVAFSVVNAKFLAYREGLETELKEHRLTLSQLKQTEAQLKLFVRYAPAAIAMFDKNMRYLIASERWNTDYGLKLGDIVGRSHYEIFPEMPERWKEAHHRALQGIPQAANEDVFPRSDGTVDWVRWEIRPWLAADGEIGGLLLFSEKITEQVTSRKRIEGLLEDLKKYSEELERTNADLRRFTYIASHDLKEPLRMVTSYTQLLAKRYQGRLDSDADMYLKFASQGATRMYQLIDDLLAYTKVSEEGGKFAAVDMNSAVSAAIESLGAAAQEPGIRIEIGPLPVVRGKKALLVQLFYYLIENSIKYRRENPCVVRIGSKQVDEEWVFSVEDNGIGIEAKYFERIFVMFQRLHGHDEIPGTGMGLALCKRIVLHHRGRIWLESELGQGTTFYFTLPV